MIFDDNNLTAVFSRRLDGNMSSVYGENRAGALNNRKEFLRRLGMDHDFLVCARQVHGNRVEAVEIKDKGKGSLSAGSALNDTDALITDESNLPLSIFTADCLPIFLYDSKKHAAGLVHSGWRGSLKDIIVNTVNLMQQRFNTKAGALLVGFGPAIRQCCYEVGEEFRAYFGFGIENRNGHNYLDLAGINKIELLECGVKEEHIYDSGICTYCNNPDFFSYRKEGTLSGRMMSVIMLR